MVELICKILKIGKASYYRYKKANEPILELLNYFTKEELLELKNNSKIRKLDLIKDYSYDEIELGIKHYLVYRIQEERKKANYLEESCNKIEEEKQKLKAETTNATIERLMLKQIKTEDEIKSIKDMLHSINTNINNLNKK